VFTISYTAPSTGSPTATLTFTDNAALSNLPSNPSTPGPYTQAITLSGSGISSTAPPPSATVPITDDETITVTDTPTFPQADKEQITVIDQVSVTAKDTPTITWATPAAITYGTLLSDKQLDATAAYNGKSVAGTFAYTPPKKAVLGAGIHTLSVTFTPANTTKYATVTDTVTLLVNQATPTITWAKPAAITYGTALSSTQLDATASVTGSWVYTPVAGTLLDAGAQPLSVMFTPTDTTDYTTATHTVTLTVNKAHSKIVITSHTPNPSLINALVTVTFDVTGGGVGPTGNVTVTASTGETCTGGLIAAAGSCSMSFLKAGNRTLKAVYSGDNNFDGSTSPTVVQKVEP
jgi:hypothetical protein